MTNTFKKNMPRDVFLHFLAIITLYWSAVSFITLVWQFINHLLPDESTYQYYLGPMRFAVASLIIVFPVYVAVSWYLNRNYARNPEIREMKLRKWLIYFTLFVAALIIIGDLVRAILVFLEGDMTSRFILKALSVILVAGAIFAYYLDDVRREKPSKSIKYFVWAVCAIVLIGIIGSFFVMGSPKETRLKQMDEMILSNLQETQYQIVNFWQKKERLPENFEELSDSISGFKAPVNPLEADYEYRVIDKTALRFELCATFNKENKNQGENSPVISGYNQNWNHPAGRFCFERQIDKELYPIIKK